MTVRIFLAVSLLYSYTASALADPTTQLVNQWRQTLEQQIVDEFAGLLEIPNVASDTVNIRKNASQISDILERAGMQVELLELEGSNPVVFAQRNTPGASKTIMIYVHYDGQPVNLDNWKSDPWIPVMRTDMVEKGGEQLEMIAPFDPDWRIFGRSTGDDKAPVIAMQSTPWG